MNQLATKILDGGAYTAILFRLATSGQKSVAVSVGSYSEKAKHLLSEKPDRRPTRTKPLAR
jgi:hypothetical protein